MSLYEVDSLSNTPSTSTPLLSEVISLSNLSLVQFRYDLSYMQLLLMQEQRFDKKRSIISIESDLLANEKFELVNIII
jgi:hypothetical protein